MAMNGWLYYGAALNAGRKLFASDDRGFGHWLTSANLTEVHPHDQAAVIWAAANGDAFEATRAAHPRVRTVRGLHAKWKEGKQPAAQKVAKEGTQAASRVDGAIFGWQLVQR